MNYYFVAQGQTYQTEHSQKYLWAPIDNIWHHRMMNEVKKGDIIIQYNNCLCQYIGIKLEQTNA